MKKLRPILQGGILTLGVVAMVMLGSSMHDHPWLCLVQVEGNSMHPTLLSGHQLLVIRAPFGVNSIVLADAGEGELVIKRVVAMRDGQVLLRGDNRFFSREYCVPRGTIRGAMVCHLPFGSPLSQERPTGLWARLGARGYAQELE